MLQYDDPESCVCVVRETAQLLALAWGRQEKVRGRMSRVEAGLQIGAAPVKVEGLRRLRKIRKGSGGR